MKPADEEKLRILADAVVVSAGVGLDLEEVTIVAAGRRQLIRVVIDGDNGVSLDAAADISRALAAALDEAGDDFLGPDPYTLEVTSPGIGRPLTEERHFRRARGRLVSVKLVDGSTVEGRVRRVVDGSVELFPGPTATTVSIPLAEVRRAKVEVEFAKMPPAHVALLDADGFVDPARAFDDVDADELPDAEGADDDSYGDIAEDDLDEEEAEDFFEGELLDPADLEDEQHHITTADLESSPPGDITSSSAKEGQQ